MAMAGGTIEPWNLHFTRPDGGVIVVNWAWTLMAILFVAACVARWLRSRGRRSA
jgi:hypothetical protein